MSAVAAVHSTGSLYLTSSAIITRDILKKFFVKNMSNKEQIFTARIVIMFLFIISLIFSVQFGKNILSLGSFALAMACQMFVPLLAICYIPWFTKLFWAARSINTESHDNEVRSQWG